MRVRQSSEATATDGIRVSTDLMKSFIAGGFGGASAVLVGMFKLSETHVLLLTTSLRSSFRFN